MLLLKDWWLFRDENMDKWVFCFPEIEKAILMRQTHYWKSAVCVQTGMLSLLCACMDGSPSFISLQVQKINLSSQVEGPIL